MTFNSSNIIVKANSTLAIDGYDSATGGIELHLNLVTTSSDDIIYLSVISGDDGGVYNIISNPSLDWSHQRASNYFTTESHLLYEGNDGGDIVQTYWALKSESGSIAIDVTFNKDDGNIHDESAAMAFGISGAKTDCLVGNPLIVNVGASDSPNAQIPFRDQYASETLVFGVLAADSRYDVTPGQGFTIIGTTDANEDCMLACEYKIVDASNYETDVTCTLSTAENPAWVLIAEHIPIKYPSTPCFEIKVESPINILLIDQFGKRVGYDSSTQSIINEITGATYTGPGTEPQTITLPGSLEGTFFVQVCGTETGSYTLTATNFATDGSTIDSQVWTGTINPRELLGVSFTLNNDGSIVGGNLFNLPEYGLGALVALAACFAGFIAFKKRKSLPKLNPTKQQVYI